MYTLVCSTSYQFAKLIQLFKRSLQPKTEPKPTTTTLTKSINIYYIIKSKLFPPKICFAIEVNNGGVIDENNERRTDSAKLAPSLSYICIIIVSSLVITPDMMSWRGDGDEELIRLILKPHWNHLSGTLEPCLFALFAFVKLYWVNKAYINCCSVLICWYMIFKLLFCI